MSAAPQVQDGFVRIASELYDAILLADLSKRELLVLFAIIRKTYGFNKKEDDLTNTMLAGMTGLDRANVSRAIDSLEARGVIKVTSGQFGKVLGVQKNYRSWVAETAPKSDAKTASKGHAKLASIDDAKTTRDDAELAHAKLASPCQNDTPPDDAKTASAPCQIGISLMPKRHPDDAKTAHTIDNPNRQPQKTTPIDIGSGPVGPQPGAGEGEGKKEPPTSATWTAYSEAYQDRYGVAPPRNAKASGMLKQLLARIGAEEAPEVARWYLGSNDRWYVQKGHAIDYLLNDAEKLRTEWATRRRITATAANQADRTQANGQVWAKLIREAEEAQRG